MNEQQTPENSTLEACREELKDSLEEWIVVNLVHFETRSSAGNMSATTPREQDAPTTFKMMVFQPRRGLEVV